MDLEGYLDIITRRIFQTRYSSIRLTNEIAALLQDVNVQANFQLRTVLNKVATEPFREGLVEFADISTVEERLNESDSLAFDFQGMFNGWCRASFVWANKEEKTVMYMVRLIEKDKLIENQLRYKIENDSLTGFRNEEFGVNTIKQMLDNKKPGMFCLIEVDNFKEINDKYGNDIGDNILVEIADCIKESFKEGDVFIRRGGARFAIFSVDVKDKEDGRFIMKMLESMINVMTIIEEQITISSGVVFNRV